jgi:type VII secretion protein EccB
VTSRQSQLHSYQFALQRLVSALVTREPDPAQAPFRKVGGAAFGSVMIAVLALGAVGVYGLVVSGGNTSWRSDNTVVVERESGAKFVYLSGKLHPVLNFASALLIARSPNPKVVSVSRKSLSGAARGTPLGIAGVPDSLPARGRLLTGAWSVCSGLVRQADSSLVPRSALVVGGRPGQARSLGAGEAFFVRDATAEYMIWNARKFQVQPADRQVVRDALAVRDDQVAPVATALINTLPAGLDLGRVKVPGTGRSAATDLTVGDLVVVTTPGVGPKPYVALADGLAPVTQLQAGLLSSGGATVKQQTAAWFARQPRSAANLTRAADPAALPEQPPTLVRPPDEQRAACAVFADRGARPEILVDAGPVATPGSTVTGSRSGVSGVLADLAVVTPGWGAVVEALPSPDAPSGTLLLVTDLGTAFPVPNRDVLGMLGYRDVQPLRLPSAVVALLPLGQALDPDLARSPAVVAVR